MHQKWRELLFLHWAVPPESVRALLPSSLELDLYEGRAYVGLVAFTMCGVRPVAMPPVPGLSSFHETNLRTYVHFKGRDPGVWFFSLDAANAIAVRLARRFFHLPYHHARMFLEREWAGAGEVRSAISYAGVRRWPGPFPGSYVIRAEISGPVVLAVPGSLEHFLAERYMLYCRRQDSIFRGRVHHVPYPLQSARVLCLDETLFAASGLSRPACDPIAHYAAGVDVEIFGLESLRDDPC
jgi:uncharacterized protein YqjF (DUF2071 family)